MTDSLNQLRQQGLSELACQFAAFIDRKEDGLHPLVSLSAGLLVEAMEQGHVCLNLCALPDTLLSLTDLLPKEADSWQAELRAGKSVGQPGDYKPLILTDDGLLYLYRFWRDERDVALAIQQRLHDISELNVEQLNQDLADWHNPVEGVDWQKVAVAMALSRQFSVISGGPGTGKTTIVLKILQCLHKQYGDEDSDASASLPGEDVPALRIGLAAPTGKAAARLQQAISQYPHLEVKTLHRLLGITEHNDQGRYHSGRRLPLDVLIVDEASMIDISLMAKLMRAIPEQARLILLGDSQQLASVESGAVLANLSEQAQGRFSENFVSRFPTLGLTEHCNSQDRTLLTDSFVHLQHSYRFDKDSLIGQLAEQVNAGHADHAMRLLRSSAKPIWQLPEEQHLLETVSKGYQDFIDAIEKAAEPQTILHALEQFRVLAALKQGPMSVASVNRMMHRFLAQRGWRTGQTYYPGRPIMITQNDYRQKLFNGDTGVILQDETGRLGACFCFGEDLRWVGLSRLPAHETVFAMTVHKSQGSEFDAISILLPEEINPILNRELLYTAITRARKSLTLLASEPVLSHTILHRHQRESGLKNQLESARQQAN